MIKTGIEHIKKLYNPLLIRIEPAGVNTAATVLNQNQFQLKRNQFDSVLLYNYCHAQWAVYIIETKYNSDMYLTKLSTFSYF